MRRNRLNLPPHRAEGGQLACGHKATPMAAGSVKIQ